MKSLTPLKIWALLGVLAVVAPGAPLPLARGQAAPEAVDPAAPIVVRQADGKRLADLKLSRDGKTAFVTSAVGGVIEVYDLTTGELLRTFKGGMGAFELALSPGAGAENGRVASSTLDFWVSVNDIADGKQRAHFFLQAVGGATSLDWSPDGKMLATASSNQVALFDPNSDSPDANILARHEAPIGVGPGVVAFSPDGAQLVAGYSDRALTIYDAANYDKPPVNYEYRKPQLREVGQLSGHEGAITTLAWSPDGKTLASGDASGGVRLWNYATRESRIAWTAGDSAVQSLAFAPDGQSLAVATQSLAGEAAVTLWDVTTGQAKQSWKHDQTVNRVAFVNEGKSLIVADAQGAVMRVPVATLSAFQAIAPLPLDLTGPYLKLPGNLEISALDWSHDGRLLASAGRTQLIVRDLKTGARMRVPQTHEQSLTGVTFSPDDSLLATSSYGGIEVADVAEKRVLWQSKKRGIIAGWSSDGATLYVAQGSQKTAKILALDARTGAEPEYPIGMLSGTFYNSPIIARLSPDKKRMAVTIFDKDDGRANKCELQVFDVIGKQKLWSAPLNGRCDALAWSGDGQSIVAKAGERADAYPNGNDYVEGQMGVKWFDAATGKVDEARTRLDFTDEIETLTFAPDGQTLLVFFGRGLPQLWDKNGQSKGTLEPATTNLVASAFSPDGQHLVAAGKGAPLQFWSWPPKL